MQTQANNQLYANPNISYIQALFTAHSSIHVYDFPSSPSFWAVAQAAAAPHVPARAGVCGGEGGQGGHVGGRQRHRRPLRSHGRHQECVMQSSALEISFCNTKYGRAELIQAGVLALKHESRKIAYFWVVRKFKVLGIRTSRFGLLPAMA